MTTPTTSPFITRVVVENDKSIASCDVRLGPLNVLVGLNGSGKSTGEGCVESLAPYPHVATAIRDDIVRRHRAATIAFHWIRMDVVNSSSAHLSPSGFTWHVIKAQMV